MVRILLVGSDYRLVPPSRLEQLTARCERIQAALLEQKEQGILRGALLLSTCNRLEVLLDLDAEPEPGYARKLLGCGRDFPVRQLADEAAVEHFLGVSTGLLSMVFGEEQVLGQVRKAFKTAEEFGLLSRRLHMLRSRLLSAAREIRHRAGLDQRPRSVAAMAVDRVIEAGPRIAVVGAGETGHLVLEILQRRQVRNPLVVNRTLSRAEALARHFGGRAMALRDFLRQRPELDGIVLAIRSERPILGAADAAGLRVVVDISQPSVLEEDLRSVAGLEVFDLDDLAALTEQERAGFDSTAAIALPEVQALAKSLWKEIGSGRPNLGRVVDLHIEGALAELEQAFSGSLRHLPERDRQALRAVLLRAAKRNAHYHIQDIRQLAVAQ